MVQPSFNSKYKYIGPITGTSICGTVLFPEITEKAPDPNKGEFQILTKIHSN
jgi:hypothetical protein